MKFTFMGCLGIIVGIFFWMIIFVAAIGFIFGPQLQTLRRGTDSAYGEVMMRVQAIENGSDRITAEDVKASSSISQKEVNKWRTRYPALKAANKAEVREMIVILKRHPNWQPRSYESGVVALTRWGTISYHFESKERNLLGQEVLWDKFVAREMF